MERYGQDDNRRNVFREEKYMGDTNIDYDEKFGITTFQREICAELGEGFWKELTDGLTLPDIESECRCQCHNMYLFMERFGRMADKKNSRKDTLQGKARASSFTVCMGPCRISEDREPGCIPPETPGG